MTRDKLRHLPRSPKALRSFARTLGIPDSARVQRVGPSVLTEPWDGVTYEALAVEDHPSKWQQTLTYVGRIDSPAYWEARTVPGRKPIVTLRGIEEVERARWLVDGFRTWRGRPPGSWQVADPERKLREAVAELRGLGLVVTQEAIATEVGVDRSAVSRWWKALHLPWPPPLDWR